MTHTCDLCNAPASIMGGFAGATPSYTTLCDACWPSFLSQCQNFTGSIGGLVMLPMGESANRWMRDAKGDVK